MRSWIALPARMLGILLIVGSAHPFGIAAPDRVADRRVLGAGAATTSINAPSASPTAMLSAALTVPLSLVVHTTDDVDDGVCDGAHCSLREALAAAANNPGPDTVTFNIPTTDPGYDPATGVWTIRPNDGYDVPSETTVDGAIGTALAGQRASARPGIEIDGTTLVERGITGLRLDSSVTVRGLIVNHCQYGIWVDGAQARIENCYIGADATGNSAKPNGADGILLAHAASGAVIQGNLLSGNGGDGLRMFGQDTTRNTVRNNRIGTRADGTGALPNGFRGVHLQAGAHDNTIGPDNVIAFNLWEGVLVEGDVTRGNTVSRNPIHSNGAGGIRLTGGANGGLAPPLITDASVSQVSGAVCPDCLVEVFSDDADQGAIYEGTAMANTAGDWTFTQPGGLTGPYVTATATDAQGSTSEFAVPLRLVVVTPTVTSTTTGTATPTSTATQTLTPTSTATQTPMATASPTASPSATRSTTPSPSRSASPSASPSATPTATRTRTPTRTATRTVSPSPTRTGAVTRRRQYLPVILRIGW